MSMTSIWILASEYFSIKGVRAPWRMADSRLREIQNEPGVSCGRNKKVLSNEDMSKEH